LIASAYFLLERLESPLAHRVVAAEGLLIRRRRAEKSVQPVLRR
jgi:hypothetical protein